MRMTLSELEFLRLLPQFMREDLAVQGLAEGIDEIIPQMSQNLKLLPTWDKIDSLSEEELDELAWELNILWYEQDADIEVKRDVVKNSDKVYQHLGTKWAVENVIKSYFGTGYIKEWFEYEGQPGRFRIHSSNPAITGEKFLSFFNLVKKVKRASAKLDAVIIELESTGTVFFGIRHEMSGSMDIWPLVPREIESKGAIIHGAFTQTGGTRKILPLATKEVEVTGAAARTGVLTYQGTLEIYPQGGLANG